MTMGGSGLGEDHSLHTIHSAVRIIEYLDDIGGAGATELADAFDIPKSTAHVYLKTLAETGYVLNEDGTYRLSLRFLERGASVRQHTDLYDVARPEVDDLAADTNELANLGTMENGQRVLLKKAEGGEAVHDNTPVGEFTYMHWSSLGKAILAHLPPERVDRIVEEHGLPKATDHSIGSREELRSDLERTRARGYALENDERRVGMRAVAVPIMDDRNQVLASISVSGPKNRFGDERIDDELYPALSSTANLIQLKYVHD